MSPSSVSQNPSSKLEKSSSDISSSTWNDAAVSFGAAKIKDFFLCRDTCSSLCSSLCSRTRGQQVGVQHLEPESSDGNPLTDDHRGCQRLGLLRGVAFPSGQLAPGCARCFFPCCSRLMQRSEYTSKKMRNSELETCISGNSCQMESVELRIAAPSTGEPPPR